MSWDGLKNFGATTVATAPSPATSGTSLVVAAGGGALLPAVPFNAVAWSPTVGQPTAANAEIVRVTAKSTDTLTITRGTEGSTAQSIAVGWIFDANVTAKTITDLQTAIDGKIDQGGTLSASLTFGENTSLIFAAALSADGKYCGFVDAGTAGEALAFGEVVYLKAADSRWWKAKANADATAGAVRIGMCVLAAGSGGSATTILTYGKIRADSLFPTLTVGAPAYISGATSGAIVTAQPSTTDYVIRMLGHGTTTHELFFNPSNDYMTHT